MSRMVRTVVAEQVARWVIGAVVALGVVAATPPAFALSEWWTPDGIKCPTFDSEQSCEDFCARDQKLCGGSTQCAFQTGPERPICAVPLGEELEQE